jgi:protein gp37
MLHRRRVFSLSLGDWLDPEVPIEWLAEMLDTIRRCDQLQWLLVTKRPELWSQRLLEALALVENVTGDWPSRGPLTEHGNFINQWLGGHAPKHVMVLTSVENQLAADERIPKLLEIPGRHGLSCEPLLGPVNIPKVLKRAIGYNPDGSKRCKIATPNGVPMIDWVIAGGESGAGARACNVEWLRDLMEECAIAGVPFFLKQLGANPTQPMLRIGAPSNEDIPLGATRLITSKKGGDITEWPHELRVRQFPKVV